MVDRLVLPLNGDKLQASVNTVMKFYVNKRGGFFFF